MIAGQRHLEIPSRNAEEELELELEPPPPSFRGFLDPATSFRDKLREINYGSAYYFKPIREAQLAQVDPLVSCDYFDRCFKDPASFTLVLVGNIDVEVARQLILQYLGSIPSPSTDPSQPPLSFARDELTQLPIRFPKSIIRNEVRVPMAQAQGSAQVTFPIELKEPGIVDEVVWAGLVCRLMETKVMQALRFKLGKIYSVSVSPFLGGSRPSRSGSVKGDVSMGFACDPETAWHLVDLSLQEVASLQLQGPSVEDVSTVAELEKRAHETGLHENGYWLDRLLGAYQSRHYQGDVAASFQVQEEARARVLGTLNPDAVKDALGRLLPVPCDAQYTAVTFMPAAPTVLQRWFGVQSPTISREAWLVAACGILATLVVLRRVIAAHRTDT